MIKCCETCKFKKQVDTRTNCFYCMYGPHILQRVEFVGFEDYYEPDGEILEAIDKTNEKIAKLEEEKAWLEYGISKGPQHLGDV